MKAMPVTSTPDPSTWAGAPSRDDPHDLRHRPIADYALLSDCHSAALVSTAGSVDWLCLPRFDAPAMFARLLDQDAGHWSISPVTSYRSTRRYVPETLVLETTFSTDSGVATLTDALVFDDKERGHGIGLDAPHVLVRHVEVIRGDVEFEVELSPRPEYGLIVPRLSAVDGACVARGGACLLIVAGPVADDIEAGTARWNLTLGAGEQATWALQYHEAWRDAPKPWSQRKARKRLADTVKGWKSWSELHQRYRGPWMDEVHLSGRVLHALTYRPTGAIVAAPTTSLPEAEGSSRNWDYRYCWLRDASMTMQALWVAACPDEVERFIAFIARVAGQGDQGRSGLQIMFGIRGEHDLAERNLEHLTGWRDSRPVRIGNDAWNQPQHDVYGAILDAVFRFRDQITELDPHTIELLTHLADTAAVIWREPDQGIWEIRGEPRHYLHSKLMCWVALDRAARLAPQLDRADRASEWASTAEEIRSAILRHGWNDDIGAFTQSFSSADLDASSLMVALTGFLPPDDPRLRSTITVIADALTGPGGLVYRYSNHDGLSGDEAPFLLCSYWLAEAWARTGEVARARDVFERATAFANDLGLLAEEADPATNQLLGNYPQAFSHIGLVNAAEAINNQLNNQGHDHG